MYKIFIAETCTCFLDVIPYERKSEMMQLVLSQEASGDYRYTDKGRICKGDVRLFSQAFTSKRAGRHYSSIYVAKVGNDEMFVDILEFKKDVDGHIFYSARILKSCNVPLFDFTTYVLPGVSKKVIDIMTSTSFIFVVKYSSEIREIPVHSIASV